jgi:GDSL-like Lipase/Acylhydrolase family
MSKTLLLFVLALTMSGISNAQTDSQKKRVAIIGSSTAAGMGANTYDSSWVGRIQTYWEGLELLDTTIINLAVGGSYTYSGLPTYFISPISPEHSNDHKPDTSHNVTAALSFHPDILIVSYANNDEGLEYSVAEQMFNLRTIYDTATAAGVICYVSSTQPRTTYGTPEKDTLKLLRDSVMLEFAPFALDFYTPVVAADSLNINPLLAYDFDAIHLNDTGHLKLFQVVQSNVLLSSTPLALSLTSFTARQEPNDVLLQWTDLDETGATDFEIQRSANGSSFDDMQLEKGRGTGQSDNYSWTDHDPLPGANFYRLKIKDHGKESFSRIVSVGDQVNELTLDKIFTNSSDLMAGIGIKKNQSLFIVIMDRSGALVSKRTYPVSSPYSTISLPLAGLAAGEYFLKIIAANGFSVTKPFVRF